MANDREVKYRLTGDVSELQAALNSAEADFEDLGQAGRSIVVLENALANVQKFEAGVQAASAKVNQLKSALNEAYAADADAPQIKKLERDLGAAERAAVKAQQGLDKANAAVVKLNLDAGKAGVTTANLADRKKQLAVETDKVRAKMDALAAHVNKTATAEERAAAQAGRLNNAFSTLNIRSARQINADIQRINDSLSLLARSTSVSGAEFDRAYAGAQQQIAKLKAELAGANEASEKQVGVVGRLRGAFGGLQGVLAALGLGALGQKFIDANISAEKFERALTAITGSTKAAKDEIKFLRETSSRLGVDFDSSAAGFVRFAAATKGTALEGQKTRDIFQAVSGAMATLGASAVDQERALNALGQMMSKGTVRAEDLKGQLGDVLPGALKVASDSLGLTTAELMKLMEQGGVVSETFLPRFAAQLQNTFDSTAPVDTLAASFARVKSQWQEFSAELGKAGVLDVIKNGLAGLNAVLMVTFTTLATVVTGFLGFGKAIGVVAAAIARMDMGILRDGLSEIGAEMDKSLESFARMSNRALGLEESTDAAGNAMKEAAKAAADAGPSFEKLQVIFGDLSKSAEEARITSEKNAEARKAEGAASVAAAQAFGTEIDQRNALAAATQANAAAADDLARSRQFELGVAQAHLAQVEQDILAAGQETEAQRKLVEQLRAKVAERQASADKATAEAAGTKLAADAAVLATQAYKDNSAALDELRAAAAAASAEVEALRIQKEAGTASAVQLAEAERAEAQAKALYRDAISDQIEKITALNAAKQGEISVAAAGIRLAIEQQRSIAAVASARGQEATAARALIEIKRLEIKLAELTAQAKRAEAEAALQMVKAKREELAASGQLTAAKEAELKAMEASANVKKVEADIAKLTAERLDELNTITERSGSSAKKAAADYGNLAKSLDGVAGSAKAAGDAMNDANDAASGGGGAGAGVGQRQERVGAVSGQQYFEQKILQRDLDLATAQEAIRNVGAIFQQEMAQALKGGVISELDYRGRLKAAENAAIERAIIDAQAKQRETGTQAQPAQQPTQSTTQRESFRIEIGIGGKNRSVNVATRSDADTLRDIFKIVEEESNRAF